MIMTQNPFSKYAVIRLHVSTSVRLWDLVLKISHRLNLLALCSEENKISLFSKQNSKTRVTKVEP